MHSEWWNTHKHEASCWFVHSVTCTLLIIWAFLICVDALTSQDTPCLPQGHICICDSTHLSGLPGTCRRRRHLLAHWICSSLRRISLCRARHQSWATVVFRFFEGEEKKKKKTHTVRTRIRSTGGAVQTYGICSGLVGVLEALIWLRTFCSLRAGR